MKMHKEIGTTKNLFRSIFTLASVGVLLSFAGHVSGQDDSKSGDVCEWTGTEDWNVSTDVIENLTELEAVDVAPKVSPAKYGKPTVRFNGAIGAENYRRDFTIPAPDCSPEEVELVPTMTCGGKKIASGGNLSSTVNVTWSENAIIDGQIDLSSNSTTAVSPVDCVLSLDWVGSNSLDGPITFTFAVGVVPTPHSAPRTVRALAESSTSAYVEWTQEVGSITVTTDDAARYFIECTSTTSGATSADTEVNADPNPKNSEGDQNISQRQGAVIDGLTPNADYSCTVAGRSGSSHTTNYGRVSAPSQSGISGGSPVTKFRTLKAYDGKLTNTYKLSTGETVEIKVTEYFLNLAIPGRDDFGVTPASEINQYLRSAPIVTSFEASGNAGVDAIYISTNPAEQSEDLVRLHGIKSNGNGGWVTVAATVGGKSSTHRIWVKVLENSSPMFVVNEAEIDWYVDKNNLTSGEHTKLTIDVMEQFGYEVTDDDSGNCSDDDASNDINCDEELTFKLSNTPGFIGGTTYFQIDEDTGVIKKKSSVTASQYDVLDHEDEIGMTVTAEDASGGQDTMSIILVVDTVNTNFPPRRLSSVTNYLPALTEASGGGSRTFNFARLFRDSEGDDLCYEMVTNSTTLGSATETWAEASLGRQAGRPDRCKGPLLTIDMILPSTDPIGDPTGFKLLGKTGRETVTVSVQVYELGNTSNKSLPATVELWVLYGTNGVPNILTVAEITSGTNAGTFVASGALEVVEGSNIELTFTAIDAQPTGDVLCWTAGRNCTPCTGSEGRSSTFWRGFDSLGNKTRSTRDKDSTATLGVSHEYDLVIKGKKRTFVQTDYERNNGVYTINVCATDLSGGTHTLPFDVKLKDMEEKPIFSTPRLSSINVFMLVGDYAQTTGQGGIPAVRASDGDGDTLTYDAAFVGSCPGARLSTNASTGQVTITPPSSNVSSADGKMTCQVEVSASDGTHTVYSESNKFTITIKNDNSAPEFADGWSSIAYDHMEYVAGKPYGTAERTVGGKIRVKDDDMGDVVSVRLSPSSAPFRASARATTDAAGDTVYDITISVRTLSAMDYEADENSFDVVLVAEDKYGGAAELDVRIDLYDRNERPTLIRGARIADQEILVGVEKCVAEAKKIFTDPDHRDQQAGLFIEATTTRPGDASVSIKQNNLICITGHNVGSGAGRVKVTATDRDDESVSTTFRVSVKENLPPKVVGAGIDDQEIQENGRSMDIDLRNHFDDGDRAFEETLTFSFDVERASIATGVLIDGNFLRIYGDSKGETDVTVTATDQNDQSVSNTFEVEVIRNDPPVANADAFDDVEQYIGRDYDPIDARDAFTDEGDELTYYVSTKNSDVATAAIKYDDDDGAWIVLNLHSPGTTGVTVTVYDTANNSATNSFDLTVLARNDPPMLVNAIDDVEVEDGASHDVSLDGVFEDEGSLDYDVRNEDENIADVFYRASNNSIRIYANNTGTTTVVVTATDNIGQTASDEFDVTVIEAAPTNSAPVLSGTLEDQTVTAGEPVSVSIEGVFTDPDGDELTYTAESENTDVATVELSDLELTISGVNAGSTVFKITVTDGEFNVVGEFDVEVETIPVTVGTIPSQTLQIGGESTSLSVGEFFYDQDGDVLTYTIETSGDAATVNIAAADVSMSPYTRGSTTVMITASDPKGRSATQTFSIAVSDDELRAAGLNALAGTARAYMGSTAAALGSRLESSRSDTGMGFSFGRLFNFNSYMPTGIDSVESAALNERQALMGFSANKDLLDSTWNASTSRDVDFNFNLPTLDSLLSNNFSRTLNGNGGIGSWSIWGTIDQQNFEGDGYDGSANSMFLGIDVQTNECWLFGVTAARNSSDSDYSWGTATQTLETSLTTILPYFSYEPVDGKTSVWGVYGRGSGDADTTVVNAAAESSDLSFTLAMFGGRREFAKAGSLQLAFRGDAAFANLETDEGTGAIDDLAAGVNRIRAGIEGSFSVETGNGGRVTPFGELAFRNDGGDGLTGNGFEVAGGVRVDTNTITIEARGRWLATHSAEDFNESGVSLMLNINPSSEATGLSFSFTPKWGASSESNGMIWNDAVTATAVPHAQAYGAANGLTLNSKLAYGFALNHGKYLLTPFVDLQDSGDFGKSLVIGSELKQLFTGSRSVNMQMFVGATEESVDARLTPKLGIQAQVKF